MSWVGGGIGVYCQDGSFWNLVQRYVVSWGQVKGKTWMQGNKILCGIGDVGLMIYRVKEIYQVFMICVDIKGLDMRRIQAFFV